MSSVALNIATHALFAAKNCAFLIRAFLVHSYKYIRQRNPVVFPNVFTLRTSQFSGAASPSSGQHTTDSVSVCLSMYCLYCHHWLVILIVTFIGFRHPTGANRKKVYIDNIFSEYIEAVEAEQINVFVEKTNPCWGEKLGSALKICHNCTWK